MESGSNYIYRIYGENSAGSAWSTNLASFTAIYLPTVVNRGARVIAPGSSELRGEVTDIGSEAPHVWFHYWQAGHSETNILYSGIHDGNCSVEATGLPLGVVYEYKVVASNQAGRVESAITSFVSSTIYHVRPDGTDVYDALS